MAFTVDTDCQSVTLLNSSTLALDCSKLAEKTFLKLFSTEIYATLNDCSHHQVNSNRSRPSEAALTRSIWVRATDYYYERKKWARPDVRNAANKQKLHKLVTIYGWPPFLIPLSLMPLAAKLHVQITYTGCSVLLISLCDKSLYSRSFVILITFPIYGK
jgi:hypothetical protein